MVKMKKSLFLMAMSFFVAFLVVLTPDKAFADEMSEEFQTILNSDGKFVVTGTTMEEYSNEILVNEELQKYGTENYSFYVGTVEGSNYEITLSFYDGDVEPETHIVEVVFLESYSNEFATILNSNGKFQVPSSAKDGVAELIDVKLSQMSDESQMFEFARDLNDNALINEECTKATIVMKEYKDYDWVPVERHIVDLVYLTEPSDAFKTILKNGKLQVPSSVKTGIENILISYLNNISVGNNRFQVADYNDDYTKATIRMIDSMGDTLEQHIVDLAYLTEKSDAFKKLLNKDGKLVIDAVKPRNEYEFNVLFELLVSKDNPELGYVPSNLADDYSAMDLTINSGTVNQETHRVEIVYNYDKDVQRKLQGFVDNFPRDIEFFHVRDLELINYWINNVGSNGTDNLDAFSGELKAAVNNNNIEYYVSNRMGEDTLFCTIRVGMAIFKYNGCVYYLDETLGTCAEKIIYVPDTTGNSKEELIAAAQKRINEYLGNTTTVKVSYAGTAQDAYDAWVQEKYEETRSIWEQFYPDMPLEEFIQWYCGSYTGFGVEGVTETDDTFLITVKVGNKEQSFNVLIRKDSSKMVTPSYKTADMRTNIEISSTSTSVPLDAYIQVSEITSGEEYEKILKLLNVKENAMFDLKLYSGSLAKYVTKLEDGTFEVKIPVPDNLKNKKLVAYYTTGTGEPEIYEVEVTDDGYAIFKTKHFSIYTLAEADAESGSNTDNGNPNTGDNASMATMVLMMATAALTIVLQLKKTRIEAN